MIEVLRAFATELLGKMDEPQLKAFIRQQLEEELVVPPVGGSITYAAPVEVKRSAPIKGRQKKERPAAPMTKVLRAIGRGFKTDIMAHLQNVMKYPVPQDSQECERWLTRSLSKYSDRIRVWPDGSYSLLDYELPAPTQPD
jgi:hypothetical protein